MFSSVSCIRATVGNNLTFKTHSLIKYPCIIKRFKSSAEPPKDESTMKKTGSPIKDKISQWVKAKLSERKEQAEYETLRNELDGNNWNAIIDPAKDDDSTLQGVRELKIKNRIRGKDLQGPKGVWALYANDAQFEGFNEERKFKTEEERKEFERNMETIRKNRQIVRGMEDDYLQLLKETKDREAQGKLVEKKKAELDAIQNVGKLTRASVIQSIEKGHDDPYNMLSVEEATQELGRRKSNTELQVEGNPNSLAATLKEEKEDPRLLKIASDLGNNGFSSSGFMSYKVPRVGSFSKFYLESYAEKKESLRNYSQENQMNFFSRAAMSTYSTLPVTSLDKKLTNRGGIDDANALSWESLGGLPTIYHRVNLPAQLQDQNWYTMMTVLAFGAPYILIPLYSMVFCEYSDYEVMLNISSTLSTINMCALGTIQIYLQLFSHDNINNARRQAVAILHYATAILTMQFPTAELLLLSNGVLMSLYSLLDFKYIGQILPADLIRARSIFCGLAILGTFLMLYITPLVIYSLGRDMTTLEDKKLKVIEQRQILDERRNRILRLLQKFTSAPVETIKAIGAYFKIHFRLRYDENRMKTANRYPLFMMLQRFNHSTERDINEKWVATSDGDFGGESKVKFQVICPGEDKGKVERFARFEGVVKAFTTLEQVLGFGAIFSMMPRYSLFRPWIDLERYKYIAIRCRGDGNVYRINLRCPRRLTMFQADDVFTASFRTFKDGAWREVKIPLSGFRYHGTTAYNRSAVLTASRILQVGIIFNPYDESKSSTDSFEEVPFKLDIDYIKACNDYDETVVTMNSIGLSPERETHDNWLPKTGQGRSFRSVKRTDITDFFQRPMRNLNHRPHGTHYDDGSLVGKTFKHLPEYLIGRKNEKRKRRDPMKAVMRSGL